MTNTSLPSEQSEPTGDGIIDVVNRELTIGELQDLNDDSVRSIYVDVTRRAGIGADRFGGLQLLPLGSPLSTFTRIDDALAFIDDLHEVGLPGAVREQSDDDLSADDIVELMAFSPSGLPGDEYIEKTGCEDPYNLTITCHVEIPVSEHSTASHTRANHPVDASPAQQP